MTVKKLKEFVDRLMEAGCDDMEVVLDTPEGDKELTFAGASLEHNTFMLMEKGR